MFLAILEIPLWILSSILVFSVQYAVVSYTVAVICLDVFLMLATGAARRALDAAGANIARLYPHSSTWKATQLRQRLQQATTYPGWLAVARELEELEGLAAWRAADDSELADCGLLRRTTARLAALRARIHHQPSLQGLLHLLQSVLDRHFGGVDAPGLFACSRVGTKHAVEDFLAEVQASLRAVAATSGLSQGEKASFFRAAHTAVGQTALALSGGGALAMYHMGVLKALLAEGVMPPVVSGTSGGSIAAGMLAITNDADMLSDVIQDDISTRHGVRWFQPLTHQLATFVRSAALEAKPRFVETQDFAHTCQTYFGSFTFEEAFARTGRAVSITVTARYGGTLASHPVVLNHLTAPRVLIWSAVAASCALPGLMQPVSLLAKGPRGEAVPVHDTDAVAVLDGSMHSDIPGEQLSRIFHVNRFVVSQVNPHVQPFMQDSHAAAAAPTSWLHRALDDATQWVTLDLQQRTHKLARLRLLPRMFSQDMHGIFTQRYRGDVTLLPAGSLLDRFKALSNPSPADMQAYILAGQRATWPHIAHIRALVGVERTLRECAAASCVDPRQVQGATTTPPRPGRGPPSLMASPVSLVRTQLAAGVWGESPPSRKARAQCSGDEAYQRVVEPLQGGGGIGLTAPAQVPVESTSWLRAVKPPVQRGHARLRRRAGSV